MKEVETKILEIDVAAVQARLQELGAVFEFEAEFFAIYYDDPSGSLASRYQVLRIRKEGDVSKLTFKAPDLESMHGDHSRDELELTIADFETMRHILQALGYVETLKMPKIRTQYALGNVHIVIDTHIDDLAYIPPYMEIEAPDFDTLYDTVKLFGFERLMIDWSAARVMRYYKEGR